MKSCQWCGGPMLIDGGGSTGNLNYVTYRCQRCGNRFDKAL